MVNFMCQLNLPMVSRCHCEDVSSLWLTFPRSQWTLNPADDSHNTPHPLKADGPKNKDHFPEHYVWIWKGSSAKGFFTILSSYREVTEALGGETWWEEVMSLGVCLSRRILWLPSPSCFSLLSSLQEMNRPPFAEHSCHDLLSCRRSKQWG